MNELDQAYVEAKAAVRGFLARAKWPKAKLAREAGLNKNTLQGCENDDWNPTVPVLTACTEAIEAIEAIEADQDTLTAAE